MISALNRLANGNLELTINIPWKKVKTTYEQVLAGWAKKAEIKGFRPGKAPQKIVEQQISKSKIYEETLKVILPEVYLQAVKEHQLKPILNPQIKVISLNENKDWQVKAITCEAPKVNLGDYLNAIKKETPPAKIWVPGEANKEDKQKTKTSYDQKMNQVFTVLLQTATLDLPSILVEQEVNRMLSRLLDQTGKLGLTVEQYLDSLQKSQEQLRKEYQEQARRTLKLEFILSAIADKEKIKVSESEVEKMIAAVPDPKIQETLKTPEQKAYLRSLLRKRQVIDRLLKLT